MKKSPFVLFETEMALSNITTGLRTARLLRGDSQKIAADRIGSSLSTYQRIESGNIESLAGVACAALLNALVVYGHSAAVLSLANTEDDDQREILTRPKRQRGRATKIKGNQRG